MSHLYFAFGKRVFSKLTPVNTLAFVPSQSIHKHYKNVEQYTTTIKLDLALLIIGYNYKCLQLLLIDLINNVRFGLCIWKEGGIR